MFLLLTTIILNLFLQILKKRLKYKKKIFYSICEICVKTSKINLNTINDENGYCQFPNVNRCDYISDIDSDNPDAVADSSQNSDPTKPKLDNSFYFLIHLPNN